MPQINHEDVLIFVYERRETRYTDLIKEFVKTKKCSKQTLLNCKTNLEAEGKLCKKLSEETKRPVYFIPENIRPEIEFLIHKREIKKEIDQMTPEEIQKLITKLKETEKMLDAAFSVLFQRKVDEALNEGREYVTLTEIRQVFEEVMREKMRPKVGNLHGKREKAWLRFVEKYYPSLEEALKDRELLDKFDEYYAKEYWEEE